MAGRRAASRKPTVFAQTPNVDDAKVQRAFDVLSGAVQELQARALPPVIGGKGSPENVVAAPPGMLYVNTDGGANITLWVKESGTGKTGWVAK